MSRTLVFFAADPERVFDRIGTEALLCEDAYSLGLTNTYSHLAAEADCCLFPGELMAVEWNQDAHRAAFWDAWTDANSGRPAPAYTYPR